jgi:hypothetical protein
MSEIITFLIFALGSIGMTHIIVDGAIFEHPRKWIRSKFPNGNHFVRKIIGCYQCTGFWVGMLLGASLITFNPLFIFACGCASSFLSDWAAIHLNSLEAQSVLGTLDDEE